MTECFPVTETEQRITNCKLRGHNKEILFVGGGRGGDNRMTESFPAPETEQRVTNCKLPGHSKAILFIGGGGCGARRRGIRITEN